MSSTPLKARNLVALATVAAITTFGVVPAAAADEAVPPALLVTEIVPNTTGTDEFEFFEVTNTTADAVDLDAAGFSFQYYGASAPVDLTVPEGIVIDPGEAVAFWVSYTADGLDSFKHDEQGFRDYFAALGASDAEYQVVRATGQPGMANGGGRGIRVVDNEGATVAEAYYGAADVAINGAAVFGVADDVASPTQQVRESQAVPSPGEADADLLAPRPEPEIPAIVVDGDVASEWPVVVSEIMPNHSGADLYEYVELANLTTEDIDLNAEGLRLQYYGASEPVDLTIVGDAVITAGRALVLWNIGADAETDLTEADFRSYFGLSDNVLVAQVYGQSAFANNGERGIRMVDQDGATVVDAYYLGADVGNDLSAHYGAPSIIGATTLPVYSPAAAMTPGVLDPAAFDVELQRETDPQLETSLLQITELLPDSANVGGADGYEFIEVYNPTDAPAAWEDFTLRYLYLNGDGSVSSSTLWPSQPSDAEIPAGGTLVLWVKNGGNQELTEADFNTNFGTDLAMGVDLVEVHVGGMANSGFRGMEIMTNTGMAINRASYNLEGDDTDPDVGIHYAIAADGDAAQRLLEKTPATPGVVTSAQVHAGLALAPAAGTAPVITDLTSARFTPGDPLEIISTVTDDAMVRTVTLTLSSGADQVETEYNVVPDGNGAYSVTIPGVDTLGKREFTYTLSASDGFQRTVADPAVVRSTEDTSPLRLNVSDGQHLAGDSAVSASGDDVSETLELSVDGAAVDTYAELESAPVFAFEATATDAYFRNGVVMDGEVLTVFDEGYYEREVTVATELPLAKVNPGEDFSVRIYAGTKAAPEIDLDENNDNFNVSNLRLVLPDGRTLRPNEGYDPSAWIYLGDSGAAVDYIEATFTAPDDAFTARAYAWDTTAVADGDHTVSAVDGGESAQATVVVDNTAPVIEPTVTEGEIVHGVRALDAAVTDAGAGVASVEATLNDRRIALPRDVSSLADEAGDYVLAITATDEVGNANEVVVPFTIPVEDPAITDVAPKDGTTVEGEVSLSATVTDPTEDVLEVEFVEGSALAIGAETTVSTGAATHALDVERAEAREATADEIAALGDLDGNRVTTSSDSKLPYVLLTTDVGADTDGDVRLRWAGAANPGAKVLLHVLDPESGTWIEADRHITAGEGEGLEDLTLETVVSTVEYALDGVVTAVVQHSEGYAGDDRSSRTDAVVPHHPEDKPRSEYDFTLAWQSDTQYYNQDSVNDYDGIYDRQLSINKYLLEVRDDVNLQYMAHNGDVVNTSTDEAQWLRADPAYAMLDEAGLPYGVLAGNHDVNQATNDYSDFSKWFGASRFDSNPWWGGDHLDNRGHYDLVTAGGIDFLFLYMGWAPGDEQIDWMNEVLAQYPERVAFVQLHEFMLTTGGLGPIPQRILDEVVAPNPNVRVVTSGHYHDAFTRYDSFDDDGDGIDDRTVTSMLFDYQGLPNGGEGYMRLLHFDNESETVHVRTYSDYLEDYNAEDPTLDDIHQDFVLDYDTLGLDQRTKVLETDEFRADALDGESIATVQDVASGDTVTASWEPAAGAHSWFVRAADEHGGVAYSDVRTVTVTEESEPEPEPEPELGFSDVSDDPDSASYSEFFAEITWIADRGTSRGWKLDDGSTEFRPFASITRDAMAAFLYRYAGEPDVVVPEESPFVDVSPESTEFYDAIVWMHQEGMSRGWETAAGQEFRPFEPITRDAMAAFVYRYAEEPDVELPEESPFVDVSPDSSEFYDAIVWLEGTGITNGWDADGGTEFRPFSETTRDAMAAFLFRFSELDS